MNDLLKMVDLFIKVSDTDTVGLAYKDQVNDMG